MSWIVDEAAKSDPSKDVAILENPEARRFLDGLLTNTFYPAICRFVQATGYDDILRQDPPRIETELAYALVRTVSFMMVDGLGYPFLRGDFQCQMDGWMLKRQFWLGLPADTDPAFMFKIIEDEMFSGNPPVLMIEKAESRPDWNIYYHITLSSGTGTSWGPGHSEKAALKTIETVITTSAEMYEESMVEGFSNMAEVERFLTIAYKAFEAC